MATFLDIGILENFSIIFVFILVFIVLYGLLEYTKPMGGDRRGLHAWIALALALIVIVIKPALFMINFMTPWFVVLFIFIFFGLLAARMFGASEKDSASLIHNRGARTFIIAVSAIILIVGISFTFGQGMLEKGAGVDGPVDNGDVDIVGGEQESTQTNDFSQNVVNTIFHPKVLGLVLILLIGMFALLFLTRLM